MMIRDTFDEDSTSGTPMALIERDRLVANWAAATTQGLKRSNNQDAFGQSDSVFAVADGMGGLSHGRRAADMAVQAVVDGWSAPGDADIRDLVGDASEMVRSLMASTETRIGTTMVAVRVEESRATVVHAGDSRAYRLRGGSLELVTRDHNLRGEMLAAGIPPSAQDVAGPMRALTSFVGLRREELRVDVRSFSLLPGDRILLCTDGVHGVFSHAELTAAVAHGSPHECAQRLASARTSTGADDATALLIEIRGSDDLW